MWGLPTPADIDRVGPCAFDTQLTARPLTASRPRGGRTAQGVAGAVVRLLIRAAAPARALRVGAWGRSPHRKKIRGWVGGPEPRSAAIVGMATALASPPTQRSALAVFKARGRLRPTTSRHRRHTPPRRPLGVLRLCCQATLRGPQARAGWAAQGVPPQVARPRGGLRLAHPHPQRLAVKGRGAQASGLTARRPRSLWIQGAGIVAGPPSSVSPPPSANPPTGSGSPSPRSRFPQGARGRLRSRARKPRRPHTPPRRSTRGLEAVLPGGGLCRVGCGVPPQALAPWRAAPAPPHPHPLPQGARGLSGLGGSLSPRGFGGAIRRRRRPLIRRGRGGAAPT